MLFDAFKKKSGSSEFAAASETVPPMAITPDDGAPLAVVGAVSALTASAGAGLGFSPPGGGLFGIVGLPVSGTSGTTNTTTLVLQTSGTATATSYPAWINTLSTASIASDMRAAAGDGVITSTDLTKLLTDLVANVTASKTGLSSAQFTDLKTIATNLTNGLSTSANLVYSMSALTFGNAMNQTWTGGGASSVSLGNLGIGSSATTLAELTGKWFMGTDLPSTSVVMQGYSTFSVNYSTPSKPIFGAGGPSASDINQGYLGDCYLLASAAEIASQNASLISSMFTMNDNGTCSVRFYENGAATYVTVNMQLANGGTIFNQGSATWASLIEKAYAQLEVGGVWTGNSGVNYGNSYSTIGNGGYPSAALEALTGATALTEYYGYGSSWAAYNLNSSLNYTGAQYNISSTSLQQTLIAALAAHNDVLLSSNTNARDSAGRTTLVAGHAMSITGFDSATGMFVVRNPWGARTAGQSWDTTFEVSLSTLLAAGDVITVDNAGSKASTTKQAPVLVTQTATQSWKIGSTVSFALPATTFRDPDSQRLTYSATLADGSALPSWLRFDATTATFSGTVGTAGLGTIINSSWVNGVLTTTSTQGFSIKVTATDTDGLSASETFAVQTPPSAPVLKNQTGTLSFIAGKQSTYSLAANTFVDPQGQRLTLSAKQANGLALPSWLTFNATTGSFTGTPPAGSSALQLVVTATNTSGLTASETFTLATPKPAAPVLTAQTAAQTVVKGGTVSFQLAANTFTDPNGESITYSAKQSNGSALPSWLTFNAATRTFLGKAPTTTGSFALSVTATDAGGATASETFMLNIAAAASNLVQSGATLGSSSAAIVANNTIWASGGDQTRLANPLH